VAGTIWKNAGDGNIKKYDYAYDNANRLGTAAFTTFYNGSFNNSAGLNYSVTIGSNGIGSGYDANGNMVQMTEMGWKNGQSETIDELTYTPIQYSNQLLNVIDPISDASTTLGDFRYSAAYTKTLNGNPKPVTAIDYTYDANGNLTSDKNKDITVISYDYLNQPTSLSVAGQTATGTITFTYDANGNKLAKMTAETGATVNSVSTNITTTTSYDAGFVYQSLQYSAASLASLQYTNNLQFATQEEGRLRGLYANAASPTTLSGLAFDYFLKGQLENTRMVLTEEQETDAYPALTFDNSASYANQNAVWDNASGQSINVASSQVTPLPVGFNNTTNGTYCGSITKAQGAIGAAKLIRVMAGDQLNVTLNYTYSTSAVNNSSANGLNTLVGSLANMIIGSSGVGPIFDGQTTAAALASAQNTSTAVNNFFTVLHPETANQSTTVPQAYLHILLFNDQFMFDNVNSIVVPITSSGLDAEGTIPPQTALITKNGYAYIYFSNESNTVVYFDNFQLTDIRGRLLETNDYYPFGLTMAAVSDMAMKTPYAQNKYRFNRKELQYQEFNDGSGLQEYDFGHRMQDPQLGRWWTLDPKADLLEMSSPYAYCYNNPLSYKDPDGELSIYINGRVDGDDNRPQNGVQGKEPYWPQSILNAVSNSGIPNSGNMFFVDGDRYEQFDWPEGPRPSRVSYV